MQTSQNTASKSSQKHKYQRLGGFLAIVLILYVLIFAFLAFRVFSLYGVYAPAMQLFSDKGDAVSVCLIGAGLIVTALSLIGGILFIVAFLRKRRHFLSLFLTSAVAWPIAYFLLHLPFFLTNTQVLSNGVEMLLVSSPSPTLILSLFFDTTTIRTVFLPFAVYILFFIYFVQSVRVRTYMKSDAYITKTLWKFIKPPYPAVPDPPAQIVPDPPSPPVVPDPSVFQQRLFGHTDH